MGLFHPRVGTEAPLPGFTAMVLTAAQSESSCSITMPGRISLPLILAMSQVCRSICAA
jgi:hypothetical protein